MTHTKLLLMAVASLALSGCIRHTIEPVASHTVRVAENKDSDVLWILYDNRLMRCTGASDKPVCVPAGAFER